MDEFEKEMKDLISQNLEQYNRMLKKRDTLDNQIKPLKKFLISMGALKPNKKKKAVK